MKEEADFTAVVPQNDRGGRAGGEGLNKMLMEGQTATSALPATPKTLLLHFVNQHLPKNCMGSAGCHPLRA